MSKMYNIRFSDGPLDGVQFDTHLQIDKLLFITDLGQRVRYECNSEGEFPQTADRRVSLNMLVTRDPESFDDEMFTVDV